MLSNLQQMVPNQQISGEDMYKTWKKNTPLLYDTLVTHVLDWPTLTTQFLPIEQKDSDSNFDTYKMIMGTQTDGNMANYLMIAKVRIVLMNFNLISSDFQMRKVGKHLLNKIIR